jgi:hypothetical protein
MLGRRARDDVYRPLAARAPSCGSRRGFRPYEFLPRNSRPYPIPIEAGTAKTYIPLHGVVPYNGTTLTVTFDPFTVTDV